MRWIVPVLFFGTTAWVARYNDQHDDRKIVFPFVDAIFPETEGDPVKMGQRTVVLLLGLSVVVLGVTIVDQARAVARRRRREDEAR